MSDRKVRGIPWMTKIDSWYQFSDGLYPGWSPGQSVIHNTAKGYSDGNGYVTIEGVKWWGDRLSTAPDWNVNHLFGTTGVSVKLYNGTRHNTLVFIGANTDSASWLTNSNYYFGTHQSSMIRDAIGFSVQSNCKGSHSTDGGSSQAYLEKVGMFYAAPNRKRYGFIANQKVAGDFNLNSKYPDNRNDKFYTYRISSSDINYVNDNKLILMGMGFQFVHEAKTMTRDSQCNLFNLRILVGDGTGLVNNQSTNRILIASNPNTLLQDHLAGEPRDIMV